MVFSEAGLLNLLRGRNHAISGECDRLCLRAARNTQIATRSSRSPAMLVAIIQSELGFAWLSLYLMSLDGHVNGILDDGLAHRG